MRKYVRLYQWLRISMLATLTVSFTRLEQILGFSLPDSARSHIAWWANENGLTRHVQCKAWLSAGFKVANVDLRRQIVEFRQF